MVNMYGTQPVDMSHFVESTALPIRAEDPFFRIFITRAHFYSIFLGKRFFYVVQTFALHTVTTRNIGVFTPASVTPGLVWISVIQFHSWHAAIYRRPMKPNLIPEIYDLTT